MLEVEAQKSVFLYTQPNLNSLKGCSLFWERIYVFESFLTDLSHNSELFEETKALLDKGILKMVYLGAGNFNVHDKIYYTIDEEIWDYLNKSALQIAIRPPLSPDSEQRISEATKLDLRNEELITTLKKSAYKSIERKWDDACAEAFALRGIKKLPKQFKKDMQAELFKLKSHDRAYLEKYMPPWDERALRNRNEALEIQLSVSNSIDIDALNLPYYALKLNGFKEEDARRYISGWEALLPYINRKQLDEFSFKQILEIRKKPAWRKAMDELAEICRNISESPYDEHFNLQVKEAFTRRCQDVLEGYRVDRKTVGKAIGKAGALAGISVIPVVGTAISAVVGIADPILKYNMEKKKQQNLPFFLNDLRA